MHVLSFGAGVDSTALLAIELNRNAAASLLGITRERLDEAFPRVDAVAFADPGAEMPHTYANVRHARAVCETAGLAFHTIAGESILDWMERLGNVPLLPGGTHICSLRFKTERLQAWAETQYAGTIHWSVGIEAGEGHRRFRSKPSDRHQTRLPLVDLKLTRQNCERLLANLWTFEVRKSACFFCPFNTEDEIRTLHDEYPELWAQAEAIEARFAETSRRKHQAFLDGGEKVDAAGRALRGTWKHDSWAEGARLFAKSVDGQRLSVAEWAERLDGPTLEQGELF